MADTFASLALEVLSNVAKVPPGQQFWLAIVGAPGSGKSTLSAELLRRFSTGSEAGAVVIPMDGYHRYRAELNVMPDPAAAHRRRGAPFTFHAEKFVSDLTLARESGAGWFPSFNHRVGDPVENDVAMDTTHRLVIVEGNYLLLDDEPWRQLQRLFDQTWFLDVSFDVIQKRITKRFQAIGLTPEAAESRFFGNDLLNAKLVVEQCRHVADRVVNLPS